MCIYTCILELGANHTKVVGLITWPTHLRAGLDDPRGATPT